MKTVVYADVLFLINFGMDLISIWLTLYIFSVRINYLKLFAAAVAGGAYGVAAVLFDLSGFLSLASSAGVSFIMILIASSGSAKLSVHIKHTIVMWGIGTLLGGAVTAICSLGGNSYSDLRTHNAPFFVLALAAALSVGVVRLISVISSVKQCDATVTSFGVSRTASLLVDSGCLVREPISGRPVVFIKKEVFGDLNNKDVELLCGGAENLEKLSPDTKRRSRLIGVTRGNGETLLIGFIPDDLLLHIKKETKSVGCIVVLEDVRDYDGYDGIIPSSVIK